MQASDALYQGVFMKLAVDAGLSKEAAGKLLARMASRTGKTFARTNFTTGQVMRGGLQAAPRPPATSVPTMRPPVQVGVRR